MKGGGRDARHEAHERVGGRFDVRVLEPSPPAVADPPFFAEDAVSGGEIVPVERPGSTSWAELCEREDDEDLRRWCEQRWLVRGPLRPLPASFAETRAALHALAEHLLAPARHAATGKIGLRFCWRGFGTPFFGADRQLRVEDGMLVDGPARHPLTTLAELAAMTGFAAGAPADVYQPSTPAIFDAPLGIGAGAARAVGDWFGYCTSLLEQLRAEAAPEDEPARVQIWPEHFDVAVDLGADGARANFGGSPGDAGHPEPYLYIGPWQPRRGAFWNEPFGASLSYRELAAGADPLEFLREGRALLQRPTGAAR